MDEKEEEDLPQAAARSEHLLSRYVLEQEALVRGLPDDDTTLVMGILLETCHGCGADLPSGSTPQDLLCSRCSDEAVWLRN